MEYAFAGEITLTMGTKVGAESGVTAGAKSGVSIKIDTDGNFRDFGVKQSTSAGVMLGPVGGEVEKSLSLIPR